VEDTFEAAAVGSALTINEMDDKTWEIIKNLPSGSGVYGAKRFDKDGSISAEWEEFGKEFWMLPAIELRRDKSRSSPFSSGYGAKNSNSHMVNEDKNVNGISDIDEKDKTSEELMQIDQMLMIHLRFSSFEELMDKAKYTLNLIQCITSKVSTSVPCTTLPPVVSRGYNSDAQEVFERGVTAALDQFENCNNSDTLQKVVLARRGDLHFATEVKGLDVMMKLKFGGRVDGHLFYMKPGRLGNEFLGCSPERLFQVRGDDGIVMSEALAGTRPRGRTSEADAELLRDLMRSDKDKSEIIITGEFIREAFEVLQQRGMLELSDANARENETDGTFFVRRLRHLQHICQSFEARMTKKGSINAVAQYLLEKLHPTPAVCGVPFKESIEFIRDYESVSFDRGMYAGPLGFIGSDRTDIVVAIRSALLTNGVSSKNILRNNVVSRLSVYAGAGIVPGSTVQGEWSETGYKLGVLSSTFSQSPLTLKSFQTPNEAWATSFVEELIRSGVTQFYICPGSRSTPMTAALARAMRSNIGLIDCTSTHDERGAAFRALGYARATKRPAAVVTSSGTAVANLYPAVMEAGLDGVPLLLITADRPYENRDTGANQAVDQIKVFSESYVRWFRDISPPSDDIPVSLALSDANHAVSVARELRGPVHLNVQFRENLAPDAGPIRGDNRNGSHADFSPSRFIDVAGFQRWSTHGNKWSKLYSPSGSNVENAMYDIASLIARSRKGIIVVGNLRSDGVEGGSSDKPSTAAIISDFAESIGFPIFAGAQSANLRFYSSAVVPYAEHLLKNSQLKSEVRPDLIIQIGSHLVSTEVQGIISATTKLNPGTAHVLLQTSRPGERADPDATVTHQFFSDVESFLPSLHRHLDRVGKGSTIGSELSPLVLMGRTISSNISNIIHCASEKVVQQNIRVWEESATEEQITLTEPQILLAMAEILSETCAKERTHLFLSNSMPVRDAEFFLYPTWTVSQTKELKDSSLLQSVTVNRGASGIDGIISSATGFAEGSSSPTTLLIGDLATIHDLNAFHNLSQRASTPQSSKGLPLTSIIVNNDGGGIFSFLPIAKHGNDVNFDEFFGTPTNAFSFAKGADAFGLPFESSRNFGDFKASYKKAVSLGEPSIVEARVLGRDLNVQVHAEITKAISNLITDHYKTDGNIALNKSSTICRLAAKNYSKDECQTHSDNATKTLVLLHGWMGDKEDWDRSALALMQDLPPEWKIISIDLPGHGESLALSPTESEAIEATNIFPSQGSGRSFDHSISIEDVAKSVLATLSDVYGLSYVDAIAGYSLGGRVSLAMKKLSSSGDGALTSDDTKLFLLGSNPGEFHGKDSVSTQENSERWLADRSLGAKMLKIYNGSYLAHSSQTANSSLLWVNFLSKWYGVESLWANLDKRNPALFTKMVQKRIRSLSKRAPDLIDMLNICSAGKKSNTYWKYANPRTTYFLAGQLDRKYSKIGKDWRSLENTITYHEVKGVGHAILSEAPLHIAEFLRGALTEKNDYNTNIDIALTAAEISPIALEKDRDMDMLRTFTEVTPVILDVEEFIIDLVDKVGKGFNGVGWGDQSRATNTVNERRGLIISISSTNGLFAGIGEVSPLTGVHPESLDDAKEEVMAIQRILSNSDFIANSLKCEEILALDGSLQRYIDALVLNINAHSQLNCNKLKPSVQSGLEMALISLASHTIRTPLPQALFQSQPEEKRLSNSLLLPINGLKTRKIIGRSLETHNGDIRSDISFPSMKVKVGHQEIEDDGKAVVESQRNELSKRASRVRADANRSWSMANALEFAKVLNELNDPTISTNLEYIEEPLEKDSQTKNWDLANQVRALESWSKESGIKYALDESLADAVLGHEGDFDELRDYLYNTLKDAKGCAAFVLKPSLLGLEKSMQLSRLAHNDLNIGAVFTSTFDSGVGLAFTGIIASLSDSQSNQKNSPLYPHGISTFTMLNGDTLTPSFQSYVSNDGFLNVAPLGRAIFGLGIDEIRDYIFTSDDVKDFEDTIYDVEEEFQAISSTSTTGREINVQVSLPLPFSDEIASSRFTDLPQQPRWSPWLNSVAYLEKGETEWTLNVRGVEFRWKAISKLLQNPKGITWESTSGLKNRGLVEFIKVSNDSCLMRVKMTLITPRMIALVFKTTGEFVKEFVENKLLKWSLESFRDVVKADLALERGDAELGDALFGAVEGRSNAIEATLSYQFEDKTSSD